MPDNTHSQNIELLLTENIKILVVKMWTGFLQIMIRSGRGFCELGKEALSSTTGGQNFEIFQNDTDKVVFLTWSNTRLIMNEIADGYGLGLFEIE